VWFVSEDGGHYLGATENNLPHGVGTLFDADGLEVASGDFVRGMLEGEGHKTIQGPQGVEKYEGSFRAGMREGVGRCRWEEDNSTYEGSWVADEMSGLGRQVLPSGHSYEGEFSAGQPSGFGMMFDPLGNVLTAGLWAEANLLEARPIPRNVVVVGKMLSEQGEPSDPKTGRIGQPYKKLILFVSCLSSSVSTIAKLASLLYPDGSFLIGDYDPASFAPKWGARKFAADGVEIKPPSMPGSSPPMFRTQSVQQQQHHHQASPPAHSPQMARSNTMAPSASRW
jgi:hypothetical protein